MKDIESQDALAQYTAIFDAAYRRVRQQRREWILKSLVRGPRDLRIDDEAKAGLCIRHYDMDYYGHRLTINHISRAVTLPGSRRMGLMSNLIGETLRQDAADGVALSVVTPPARSLYFFFDGLGYATVSFRTEARYTAIHDFEPEAGDAIPEEPTAALLRETRTKLGVPAPVLSDEEFALLQNQITMDGGSIYAARCPAGGKAIAFAGRPSERDGVTVHAVLYDAPEAAACCLAQLRREVAPNMPVTVFSDPADMPASAIRAGSMLRLVNATEFLSTVAAANPGLSYTIRLRDDIIPENQADYRLHKGHLTRLPLGSLPQVRLEADSQVLLSILFNTPRIGDAFGLPARRLPPLMLPG